MPGYEKVIGLCVDHIEDNLAEEITLTELADLAGLSSFHFHRVFHAIVGDTVMEYVRKRRLACAAHRVANSDDRLLDIALDLGFGSQETFIRAFRRLFGTTPGEYRKRAIAPPFYPRVNVLERRYNPYLGGIRMDFKLVAKPAIQVLGYSLRTTSVDGQNNREIPEFWQRYIHGGWGARLQEHAITNAEYGICGEFDMETSQFSYIIGMEVPEGTKAEDGLVLYTIPAAEYAVFTTPLAPPAEFSNSIQSTWGGIFSEWFPHSGYEHAGTPEFEYYDDRCMNGQEQVQMDIYIPVKKKEA
ncbi:AraC family transcriptional regulator [Gorillibacterium massiliense]|uniref:AraC family transcriptional regulator n=1 Tax=Gorillibacterium massiliense TaxID=1280390 RepID=UPI0004ADEB20|nr:AraC family transcriptional regulator [Gorillibacterium massiliense]